MKENLYQPFEIILCDTDQCLKVAHAHQFFELVFIRSGTGKQCINGNYFHYKEGHMFLITPEDCHSFDILTPTSFLFIRFNDRYFGDQENRDKAHISWVQRLEMILRNASHQPGCILKNAEDKSFVKLLVEKLIREKDATRIFQNELIKQILHTILCIVARNVSVAVQPSILEKSDEPISAIIQYIHQHIYSPEHLTIEKLSRHFHLSVNYFGKYFKKQTGENLTRYITQIKLKMIETRLQHSDVRLNEIAYEFNFTDVSHLNRIYKKYRGANPSAFRKKLRQPVER